MQVRSRGNHLHFESSGSIDLLFLFLSEDQLIRDGDEYGNEREDDGDKKKLNEEEDEI